MAFTDLTFGKHKGKNLAKILWTDPDWFFWMYANRKFSGGILRQAQYLYPRARSIKIPKPIPSDWKVEYIVDSYDGKFSHMSIVEKDRSPHSGSSIAYYQPVIDMNFPRSMKNYDKGGYKVMIRNLKSLFFGNLSYRVTKQRAEQFFANSNNFVLWYMCIFLFYLEDDMKTFIYISAMIISFSLLIDLYYYLLQQWWRNLLERVGFCFFVYIFTFYFIVWIINFKK